MEKKNKYNLEENLDLVNIIAKSELSKYPHQILIVDNIFSKLT